MDATARDANAGSPVVHGVIYGLLRESYPDRIVLYGRTLWLRDGAACPHPVGTRLEVIYTERDRRATVDRIRKERAQ